MCLDLGVHAQGFEQRHGEQAGGMRAEAVGKEAQPQRSIAAHACRRQRADAGQRGGTQARAGELFLRAAVFAEESEWLYTRTALRNRIADLPRERAQAVPVAQPAAPVEALRGDMRIVRQQLVRQRAGLRRRLGLAGVLECVTQPQRHARVLRRQRAPAAAGRSPAGSAPASIAAGPTWPKVSGCSPRKPCARCSACAAASSAPAPISASASISQAMKSPGCRRTASRSCWRSCSGEGAVLTYWPGARARPPGVRVAGGRSGRPGRLR